MLPGVILQILHAYKQFVLIVICDSLTYDKGLIRHLTGRSTELTGLGLGP